MPPPLIHTLAAALRRGETDPEAILANCIERVERHEPRVRAWAYLDLDGARRQARLAREELQQGIDRGPLHGIPIGIKDILDVREMPTAAGSQRWQQAIAREDAEVVARLRQRGAVILGKTVTTAYASFDPPKTRNPWDEAHTPGGSSSGSAAAVACGMCPAALATQTGGSITRPASYCGVVSFKPRHGVVSTRGVLPLAPSLDHVGVMTNSIRDAALVYSAMHAQTQGHEQLESALQALPTPVRLGRLRGFFDTAMQPGMREAFEHFCRQGSDAGQITLQEVPLPPGFAEVNRHHLRVMSVEAAAWHRERFERYPEDYPPKVTELLQRGLRTTAVEYEQTRQHREQLRAEFAGFPEGLVLLTPAATGPAPTAETTGDPQFNPPWSYLGFPTLSLPFAWSSRGLPLALQLILPRGPLDTLFRAAAALEAHLTSQHRELEMASDG